MEEAALAEMIAAIADGSITPDAAVQQLRRLPFADTGDALVDHHRPLRQGLPEVIYGPGKSPEQCVAIVQEMLEYNDGPVLITRVNDEQVASLNSIDMADAPPVVTAGCMLFRPPDPVQPQPQVLVVTAGTSDIPVADEAVITLAANGITANRLHDVGVAGLHRLLAHLDDITSADAIIVIAGMEGALSSVIGGLTSCPVIAVPTSV
ncbi:MAG: nickel pincer cofactor biosynthesis protein LarB, partial [Ilumatobacteraceae bacterium]